MRFVVVTTEEAEHDLDRLSDALLERAATQEDFDRAVLAMRTVRSAVEALTETAMRCRKAGDGKDPFLRELVVPFGRSGYLALFEIIGTVVVVAALRHQREGDYH